ncbi:MEMO1 family protein [Deltaproteobacteria bacterium]|nr:MEMO1 family protein [Deltaproteobacteria bacterium]
MEFSPSARPAVVAGRFYPGEARVLRAQVETYLALPPNRVPPSDRMLPDEDADILAALCPHAGYPFSGPIAGMTLGATPVPQHVILLGPNHTGTGEAFSLWSGGGWETPLGVMKIDETMRDALAASSCFVPDQVAHMREHSLEVLAPFLQVKNKETHICPLIIAHAVFPALRKAGEALAEAASACLAAGERALFIISSDMSHYLPHEEAVRLDNIALEAVENLDAEYFFKTVRGRGISMCGVYPMTMALAALAKLGVKSARRIAYATSGETGAAFGADKKKVVGYAGVIFRKGV